MFAKVVNSLASSHNAFQKAKGRKNAQEISTIAPSLVNSIDTLTGADN